MSWRARLDCFFGKREPLTPNPNPLNQPTLPLDAQGFIACQDGEPPFDTQVLVRLQFRSPADPVTGCTLPPMGWRCTRAPGHDGPCAAVPLTSTKIGIGMRTRKINPGHEEWNCVFLANSGGPNGGAITHWKPL